MTDSVWEPLAELEFYLWGSQDFQIYCLCSRAFIRSKIKGDIGGGNKENSEHCDVLDYEETGVDSHTLAKELHFQSLKTQEIEAVSYYCSASHYSTDDYESITQSASDNQNPHKDHFTLCPLQNSDSGADVSEYFIEKSYNKCSAYPELPCKTNLETAWEKYWSENGESIIWKSWIEKYGAYINPNYLEQNLFVENSETELNEKIKEENLDKNNDLKIKAEHIETNNLTFKTTGEKNAAESVLEKIPNLKISSYPSCGNLLEERDEIKSNLYIDESDSDEKILKSNSFGSYASYEKIRYPNSEIDKLRNADNERVRSRCSCTNLSVRSIANTTVTTDSMTNVTKITLSSLDLSCECESVKSSSLLSSSSDDSSRLSSTSSSSSKEDLCTEADTWWRQVWKEHYEDQYTSSYLSFIENYDGSSDIDKKNTLQEFKKQITSKTKDKVVVMENIKTHQIEGNNPATNILENSNSDQGFSCFRHNSEVEFQKSEILKNTPARSDTLKRRSEISDDSLDDFDKNGGKTRRKGFQKKSNETEKVQRQEKCNRIDNIKQAMTLMGFAFKEDSDEIHSGFVTYLKKNIKGQNRRLKLFDSKPKMHVFFDDDGNPFESLLGKSSDAVESQSELSCQSEELELVKSGCDFFEYESLGYEAHSSSVEGDIDESKKQKKKKKKTKKYSLPQEIMDNKILLKYWFRRYQLFSKFDKGIKMDKESWFSVTPEKIAKHHAERCRCDVIIDAFCGAGGNSIQFAFTCERVIAIDIDPLKIEIAKNNAKIYHVEDRIEFVVGDFVKLAPNLKADVVFLSPPWGGPQYASENSFSLDSILSPLGGKSLFNLASAVSENIAFFLPKNVSSNDIVLLCKPGGEVEIEQNFMDRRLRALTAYFGELIMDPEDPFIGNN